MDWEEGGRRLQRWALVGLLLLGTIVRAAAFPHRSYYSDSDEYDYLYGGAAVLEGLPPTLHFAFAGPETWFSWFYSAGLSARYMIAPTAEEREVPFEVRPFVAVNHALFDIAYDITPLRMAYISLEMLVSLLAVAAAFGYGRRRGGFGGAVLLGGMAAFLPVLIAHAAMAKPYSLAWSCAIFASYFAAAAEQRPRRWIASAIFMGLAISSRVEMLIFLPMLVLTEIWLRRVSLRAFTMDLARYLAVAIATVMIVSPWSYTHLLGNLRVIATIRFTPPIMHTDTEGVILSRIGLFAAEAIIVPMALVICATVHAVIRRADARAAHWPWLASFWALWLVKSAMLAPVGLRHQGPVFMSLLMFTPFAAGFCWQAFPRTTRAVIALALVHAGGASLHAAYAYRSGYIPDEATQWVNTHVPARTIVYVSRTYHDPLPTTESANAIWDEVMSREAERRKFESGLTRLKLGDTEMPVALSEQNMSAERGLARHFYILGTRADRIGPRFDVRRYKTSMVFGPRNPLPDFLKTGGVLIWRCGTPLNDDVGPLAGAGQPVKQWTDSAGTGTYIYASDDVRKQLKPD